MVFRTLYWCNTGVGLSKNIGDDPFNFKQKVLSFISKSWAVEKEVIHCFHIKTANTNKVRCVYKAVFKLTLFSITTTIAETGEENKSCCVANVKNIVVMRSYQILNLFEKLNIKESYKYANPIYCIQLMLMQKESRKKLFLTLNWGFTNFWPISCLVWIVIWRN